MTKPHPRIVDTPLPSVIDTVEKMAPLHGERRARRAGTVTLLKAASLFYERHIADLARAREAMHRALEDYARAEEGERYWRGAIEDLADELAVVKTATLLEHRNMFKRVTVVPVGHVRADDDHIPIGETIMHFTRTTPPPGHAALLARGGRCWKPKHPHLSAREASDLDSPCRCVGGPSPVSAGACAR